MGGEGGGWGGRAWGARLRVEDWNSESISSWKADREVRGDDSQGGLQWRQATARAHQQTGQLLVALLAGGGCSSSCAEQSGLATSVHSLGNASAQEHGRSFDRRDVWVGLKPAARLRTS